MKKKKLMQSFGIYCLYTAVLHSSSGSSRLRADFVIIFVSSGAHSHCVRVFVWWESAISHTARRGQSTISICIYTMCFHIKGTASFDHLPPLKTVKSNNSEARRLKQARAYSHMHRVALCECERDDNEKILQFISMSIQPQCTGMESRKELRMKQQRNVQMCGRNTACHVVLIKCFALHTSNSYSRSHFKFARFIFRLIYTWRSSRLDISIKTEWYASRQVCTKGVSFFTATAGDCWCYAVTRTQVHAPNTTYCGHIQFNCGSFLISGCSAFEVWFNFVFSFLFHPILRCTVHTVRCFRLATNWIWFLIKY